MGGLAVWERCPASRALLLQRTLRSGDIDLVVQGRHRTEFERLLTSRFGLLLDPQLGSIPGEVHSRFYNHAGQRICDVTYDRIVYCHTIDLKQRLTTDCLTIPLAELLLSKLQIVQPSEKDVLDIIALTSEYSFGTSDDRRINLVILRGHCAADWALEHTALLSIYRCYGELLEMAFLDSCLKSTTALRLLHLAGTLYTDAKPLRWRLRSLRGAGKKWYNEVESLQDPPREDLRRAL